jgi:hypothetical protein
MENSSNNNNNNNNNNESPVDLELLQKRLRELEYKVLSNEQLLIQNYDDIERNPFDAQIKEEQQLLFRINEAENKLSGLENAYVKEMYKKCMCCYYSYEEISNSFEDSEMHDFTELESFIEEHSDKKQDELDFLFSKTEKMNQLFSEEHMIDALSSKLAQLEQLVPFIQSDFHHQVAQINVSQLIPLTRRHDETEVDVAIRSQRIHQLLSQYNEVVSVTIPISLKY